MNDRENNDFDKKQCLDTQVRTRVGGWGGGGCSIKQNIYTEKRGWITLSILDKCNCRQKDYYSIGKIDIPVTYKYNRWLLNKLLRLYICRIIGTLALSVALRIVKREHEN